MWVTERGDGNVNLCDADSDFCDHELVKITKTSRSRLQKPDGQGHRNYYEMWRSMEAIIIQSLILFKQYQGQMQNIEQFDTASWTDEHSSLHR